MLSVLKDPALLLRKRDRIVPATYRRVRELWRVPQRRLGHHGILASADDRRIAALRDAHKGERAFVIGNGPSLTARDLDKIAGEITFAANKITLIFDETRWRPTYYMVEDPMVIAQTYETVNRLKGMTKLLKWSPEGLFSRDPDTIFWDMIFAIGRRFPRFSTDPGAGVYCGHSVCYSALQFAYFMGIRRVYLIGMDFSFKVPNVNADGVIVGEGEINHFSPKYRPAGEKWVMPKLDRQERGFAFARKVFEADGRAVFNATRGGKLEVLERADFDSLF